MPVTIEALKQRVIEELNRLDFRFDETGDLIPPAFDKTATRRLHESSQRIELQKNQNWLKINFPRYQHFFANGSDIVPPSIKPALIKVTEQWHHDLFRVARLLWSLPYSQGYGRRLRYLLFDESNGKLMGIFAMQSPPISFPARDRLFKYPDGRKTEFVNQTMDIQTLGAMPPYARLLGGKLVALAVTANEVREAYRTQYTERVTEMEGRILPAHLVALTTTSAFGRSSIYNRLVYKKIDRLDVELEVITGKNISIQELEIETEVEEVIAESLGYTEGYGSFHLMELYPLFREFLEAQGISTKGGFGTGPRPKWQILRRVLDQMGFSGDLLKHGIKREAFLFPLILDLKDYLEGRTKEPKYYDRPFADLAQYWRERWLLKRFERVDGWHKWDNQEIAKMLILVEGQNGNGRIPY